MKKIEEISMYRLTIGSKALVKCFLQFLKLCDKLKINESADLLINLLMLFSTDYVNIYFFPISYPID